MGESKTAVDILAVAAFEPELAALPSAVFRSSGGAIGGFTLRACALGVGAIAAAIRLEQCLADAKPRAVILLGSCGVYPQKPVQILDLVVATTTAIVDAAVVDHRAETPSLLVTTASACPRLSMGLATSIGARKANVATTTGVTISDAYAALLGSRGFDVENMETFGVFSAAIHSGVRCGALLGVTNHVGSTGRAEWSKHYREVAVRTANALVSWCERGAPGLKSPSETS